MSKAEDGLCEEGAAVSFLMQCWGSWALACGGQPKLPQGLGRYLGHLGPVSPLSVWPQGGGGHGLAQVEL